MAEFLIICICNVYLLIRVYYPLPLVVSACLAIALFLLVVYSLFPMVVEIKSFDLILLTRLKPQELLL